MIHSDNSILLPEENKPQIRELALANGMSYPTDEELIMLMLGKGTKNCPVDRLAARVIKVINTSTPEKLYGDLLAVTGIGQNRALMLCAMMEFGSRRNKCKRNAVKNPSDLVQYLKHYTLDSVEHFVTITLNGSNEIISIRNVSTGTIDKTIVHSREVFANAVMEHASGIICCHNHPGGNCLPSKADYESTQILQEASMILGIRFLDHLIIAHNSYFSFREHHLLDKPAC